MATMSEIPEAFQKGMWPFMGHEFFTERGVLYPRTESTILVETVVDLVKTGAIPSAPRVLDPCGGSGALGIAVALFVPTAHVWTTDIMEQASALSRRNVAKHHLESRVEVHTGDLFKAVAGLGLEGTIDAILCSPPFISTGRLSKDRAYLLDHEPREAFDAGPYGVSMHMRLIKESLPLLKPGGYLVCEYGEGQAKQVEALVTRAKAYDQIRVLSDGEGVQRALCARKMVAATSAV